MVYTRDEGWGHGLGGSSILGILRPKESTQPVSEVEGNGIYKSLVLEKWSKEMVYTRDSEDKGSTQPVPEASWNGLHYR